MLLRPSVNDLRLIGHDLGKIMGVVAGAGLLPLAWAVAKGEWRPASHLVLMVGVGAMLAGLAERLRPSRRHRVDWSHGLVVVALTWMLVPAIGTIPLILSGHYGSWIDSYFDAMSGITTTGLAVIQDLDHLADSVNVWRHTLQFLGGQGIVLAALLFFSASGALSLYQAEGRDERIFPSVGSTARFIWLVSVAHLVIGVTALTLDGIFGQGFTPGRSFFHAFTVFMAAFDTGGFSPQSTSIGYYHSAVFEVTVAVLMVAGAMSFGLHHALWNRRKRLLRNLEIRTIILTFTATLVVTTVGLGAAGPYDDMWSLARRAGFQALSAHTGTGFSTVSSAELGRWSGLAFAGIAAAMAFGGMGSSTAGGVKSLRIGLTLRGLLDTVRAALLPEKAVVSAYYQQYGRQRLDPRLAQSVMAVSLLYVALYLFGAAVGVAYGYGLQEALFESVSASAAVGLSTGVTSPSMPVLLKLVMILQMWIGRLEFVAAFALAGFLWSMVRGK
jgi:trk system potassium uptake protein TrkH